MRDEYVKETALVELTEIEREEELILNIIKTKKDLHSARKNFEYVDSQDLVDYYIYQIKANQSKLDYLIKLAKSRGIISNIINEIEFKLQNRAG